MSISESDDQDKLPRWRQFLIDIGLTYLGWVVPSDRPFQVSFEPVDKSWSLQLLEEDAARKNGKQRDA